MNRKGVVRALLLVAGGLVVVADPVAAQGADSVTEQLIRDLNQRLLAVAVPITLVVEGILVYTVWKFKDADEPEPTKENRRLEITWTVATAIVLVFVGVASYGVMANNMVIATGENAFQPGEQVPETVNTTGEPVVVNVTGVQWFWRFEYPRQNVSTQGEVVIPANRTVIFRVTSSDVIHAFHVPELGLKQDAIPGQWNYIRTQATEPGTYRLYCAEYCGAGHSQMLGNVTVMNQSAYQSWLAERSGGSGDATGGNATGGNGTTTGNATGGDGTAADGGGNATATAARDAPAKVAARASA